MRACMMQEGHGIGGPQRHAAEEHQKQQAAGVMPAWGQHRIIRRFMCPLAPVQVEQKAAVANIGEDLFAIALDQPFRFPASFTFVLRAFTTLEGLGRALSPGYQFAAVAQPFALQLLQLQARAPLFILPTLSS